MRSIYVEKNEAALSSRCCTLCATWRKVSDSYPDTGPAKAIRLHAVDIDSRIAKYGLLLRSLKEKSTLFIAAELWLYTHSYGHYREGEANRFPYPRLYIGFGRLLTNYMLSVI